MTPEEKKAEYKELRKTKEGRRKIALKYIRHLLIGVGLLLIHIFFMLRVYTEPLFRYGLPLIIIFGISRDLFGAYDVIRYTSRYNNVACRTIYHQMKSGKWMSLKAIKPNAVESDKGYSMILTQMMKEGLIEKSKLGYRIAPAKQQELCELTGAASHPIPFSLRVKGSRPTR